MASNIGQGTVKLYYEDAYLRVFDAVVLSCHELCRKGDTDGPARFAGVLDRPAFFPEEGGQSPDRGTIRAGENGSGDDEAADVLDVQIHEGVITHTLDRALPVGAAGHGELDFDHRFSNMQQHSAEHIFSGLVHSRCGFENVGFHLSDTEVTMDYSGAFDADTAAELELEVNRAIWKNIASEQHFPSAEELKETEYRSKIEIDGQVRLIVYPGYDVCACCAPHVARTGEIGIFKVIAVQSYKGGVRVHMLAGRRALAHLSAEHDVLTRTARFLSTGFETVPERVEALKNDLFLAKKEAAEAGSALLSEKIRSVPAGQRNVCLFSEGLDAVVLRNAVNELMEAHAGFCAVFDGNEKSGFRYVLGCSSGDAVRSMQKILTEKLGAKGGGKPPMTQGSVKAERAAIRQLFEETALC